MPVSLPPDPIEIEADPLRLSQVLSNLLTNAAKYMDAKGTIEVNALIDGQNLCLSVKDRGIGLDSASLPTIFEMFSQVKGVLDRSEGGLGIGLALVKGIVNLHGGRIEAVSAGLGQGSEFRLWLPMPAAASTGTKSIIRNGFQLPIATRRILVVDDNRDAAQSLGFLLEQSGHAIGLAHDGSQALVTASDFRPDIAFLDIGLPNMNGYELAHAIRNEPWGERVVLIALTGWGHQDDKRRAREAGFNGHLTKPVDPDRIEALIAEKLDPAHWQD
jgi:CheY-like chemotaxis protein